MRQQLLGVTQQQLNSYICKNEARNRIESLMSKQPESRTSKVALKVSAPAKKQFVQKKTVSSI